VVASAWVRRDNAGVPSWSCWKTCPPVCGWSPRANAKIVKF